MGVASFTEEVASPVAPGRLFKAMILDAHALVPKLLPKIVKSVDVVIGKGEAAATVAQTNYVDGRIAKHKFDLVDKENLHCKHALLEGEELKDGIESIVYDVKFEASPDGGSIVKRTSQVHAAGSAEVTEEDLKASNEKVMHLFKVVEAYLLENPTA